MMMSRRNRRYTQKYQVQGEQMELFVTQKSQIYAEKDKVTQKSQIYAESLLGKDIYLYCSFISAYFCVFLRDINIICVREKPFTKRVICNDTARYGEELDV